MKIESRERGGLVWRSASLGCITLLLACGPAIADDGGFFGRLLNTVQQVAVQTAWQGIDPAVQNCLLSKYNLDPSSLAAQSILPIDPRVSQQVEDCKQLVAQQNSQPGADQQQEDPAVRMQGLTAKYGSKVAKKIVAGNIDMGFTKDEVAEAWGNPNDRSEGGKGKEIWLYGQDKVTFTRGKVSAVSH